MVKFIDASVVAGLYPNLDSTSRNALNESITKMINEYCNTTFEEMTYTGEKYDSKAEFVPDHLPINSVTTLIDDENTAWVEDTDYYVYHNKIIINVPSNKRKAITITYKAGFTVVPEMVKKVATELLYYKAFREDEGSKLFYPEQTFEERTYKWDRNTNELSIMSKLSRWVQKSPSRDSRSSIRVGVM